MEENLAANKKTREGLTFPNQNNGLFSDSYELGQEIGSGGFSVVKLAIDKRTKQHYAVKILDKEQTDRGDMYLELAVMSRINHPNAIHYKEIFEEEDSYLVVLELVTGGELFDRIIELHQFSEKDAAHIMAQCFSALKHMHDLNIAHRDIKPENLLLSSKDHSASIKLADFGFAALMKTNKSEWIGSPPYMAPEVACLNPRSKHYCHRTYGLVVDVWSMGVVFYILLSGVHPFQIDDEEKMTGNIVAGKVEWLGNHWNKISEDAKDLIKGMLEKNPQQRLTIDQCLIHPWMTNASDERLGDIQVAIKQYQAKKRFKAAILGVIATNKLKSLMSKLRTDKPQLQSTLDVKIICGKNLASKDFNGFSDPYVVIFYGHTKYKTKIIKANLNPVWNEHFTLPYHSGENISLQCWDWDLIGSDDFMGETVIHTDNLNSPGTTVTCWYELGPLRTLDKVGELIPLSHRKLDVVSGHIQISLTLT